MAQILHFNKPSPLSLKIRYTVIGRKLLTDRPISANWQALAGFISVKKSEGEQAKEIKRSEKSRLTLVPERPAISTAAATNRPLGGGFKPKGKWLSRELMPRPWRSLYKLYLFTPVKMTLARVPETALDPCELRAPQGAGARAADCPGFDVSYCCRK